ncbi:MAG: PEP-CTERM sorting domain-containing protein [Acidobacteria bacterium]|nr:PEP-CTERM sorting domain-containing protein [Acidobacteriota bacterium]
MKPLILALSLAARLSAAALPLFNTGPDASNNPLGPANSTSKPNLLETHFSLISGTGIATTFLTRWQAPYYSEIGLNARWISPAFQQAGAATSFPSENANYFLEQTFDMTPFDISTASLSGFFAADNCAEISLNSTILATTGGSCSGTSPSANFMTLTAFSATASAFNPGNNFLRINYFNYLGPGAVLVTGLQGTADPAVPEPATYALIGASLIAIQIKRRLK